MEQYSRMLLTRELKGVKEALGKRELSYYNEFIIM